MTVTPIPLDRLVPDPSQPRLVIPPDELFDLTASVRDRGQLLPLRVRPADAAGVHVIVSGHRRHAALLAAGATHADCVVVDGPADEAAVLAEQLAENVHRQSLSPVEEAAAYLRYRALRDCSAAQAARELHVPPARLAKLLPLIGLPAGVRDRIHRGELSADAGYHLARLPEGATRDRALAQALAGDLSRDAARVRATRRPAATAVLARVVCPLAGGRSLTLSGAAVGLDTLIDSLEEVLRAARKARTAGWDVSTLAKVFRDTAATGGAG